MHFRPLRYTFTFIGPILAWTSFNMHGIWTWSFPLFAFCLVPVVELIMGPNATKLSEDDLQKAARDPIYDILLYSVVPIQFILLWVFLNSVQGELPFGDLAGRIFSMGLMCGVYGINVAHELGHRKKWWERGASRLLLLTSQYMHFYTEHNRGHHRYVATPEDPASANYREWVYAFWSRSVIGCYLSAWRIESKRAKKENRPVISFMNQMIQASMAQLLLIIMIWSLFGALTTFYYLISAIIGILLLETVNYIEHYGLKRARNATGGFVKVSPVQSWNSDHLLGRIFLFELSRHSDHFAKSSKKYQLLESYDECPQMPAGYPGMMLVSLIPPLFFSIMERDIRKLEQRSTELEVG